MVRVLVICLWVLSSRNGDLRICLGVILFKVVVSLVVVVFWLLV